MYLRDNASLQGRVIDVMPQGTSVEVYGMTQDGWYHVNYEGTEGYCYYRWLNFEGTADGTVHDGKQTEMFATCDLNVRDAPGMHGKVIGVLTTDEAVAVSHKENYWFTVDYHGQTGYCYGEYLGFTRGGYQDPNDTAGRNVMNDEVEGGATSTMNQLTVTAPLNVRTAPQHERRDHRLARPRHRGERARADAGPLGAHLLQRHRRLGLRRLPRVRSPESPGSTHLSHETRKRPRFLIRRGAARVSPLIAQRGGMRCKRDAGLSMIAVPGSSLS